MEAIPQKQDPVPIFGILARLYPQFHIGAIGVVRWERPQPICFQ
jgi:hypothetical protein